MLLNDLKISSLKRGENLGIILGIVLGIVSRNT